VRLGRISHDGWLGFAVSLDGRRWLPMPRLGLDPADTGSAIAVAQLWASWGHPLPAPQLVSAERMHCPITINQRVVGAGANYADHAAEVGMATSSVPHLFERSPRTLAADGDSLLVAATADQLCDYEVELAVVIDARPSATPAAGSSIFGYTVANDLTLRSLQRRDPMVTRAKSAPRSCPIGPYIVSSDEVAELDALELRSTVNGVQRQRAPLSDMVHSATELVAAIEVAAPLRAGDVVLTGSPAGTAAGGSAASYLQDGDVVECSISRLATLRNTVRLRAQRHGEHV
jgi:2-keto-4-pentenoate hydratase/2-oxohepta-3-ene-1,7-dioic acid hydratase in catechol pathway